MEELSNPSIAEEIKLTLRKELLALKEKGLVGEVFIDRLEDGAWILRVRDKDAAPLALLSVAFRSLRAAEAAKLFCRGVLEEATG